MNNSTIQENSTNESILKTIISNAIMYSPIIIIVLGLTGNSFSFLIFVQDKRLSRLSSIVRKFLLNTYVINKYIFNC